MLIKNIISFKAEKQMTRFEFPKKKNLEYINNKDTKNFISLTTLYYSLNGIF